MLDSVLDNPIIYGETFFVPEAARWNKIRYFHHNVREQFHHLERFWNIVKVQIPNYLEAKEWLKENGEAMGAVAICPRHLGAFRNIFHDDIPSFGQHGCS